MTNPTPVKLKTLTFGHIHPIVRHPTPEQLETISSTRPMLIEPGAVVPVFVRNYQLFQPREIRLMVPAGEDNPLRVVSVSYADPTMPEGNCYRTVRIEPGKDGIFSMDPMRGHVLGVAEVLVVHVHNPSKATVRCRPVLIATTVMDAGASVTGLGRAIEVPLSFPPVSIAPERQVTIMEEAPFKCRPRILRIETDPEPEKTSSFDLLLDDIKVGNRSHVLTAVPIELFKKGFDLGPSMVIAEPYQDIGIRIVNTHPLVEHRILRVELDVEVYDRLDHIPPKPTATT